MEAGRQKSMLRRGAAASAALLVVFLAAGEWGPGLLGIPPFIVPPLSTIAAEGLRMWNVSHLAFHTAVTFAEVVAGFALGSLLGAMIGYLLGMSPAAELALSPYILALQIAPKVAFAPLFILWMGFTLYPKILVAILIVFFPVMVNVRTASTSRGRSRRRARRSSGRSSSQPRCRRCSRACASPRRSRWSAWWWASWSAAISDSATSWPSARAKRIPRWYSSRSSC